MLTLPVALKRPILGCILLILCILSAIASSTCPTPLSLQLSNCTIAGSSVDSWGLLLDLANPSQYLCVSPSTVTNSTLVLGSAFCQTGSNITTAQCESLCGNTFDISAAGASFSSSSPSAVLAPNPLWGQLSSAPLLAGITELQLPPTSELSKYPIGIITSGNNQNVGHFGLANDSDFIRTAISNGLVPANGFGLNVGSQSVTNPRNGAIVVGGYDLARVNGAFTNFSITGIDASQRDCPLQLEIEQLVLRFPLTEGFTDINLTSSGIIIPACLEPYDTLFRFPSSLLQSFQDFTGWSTATAASVDPNLYIAEPGLYYPQIKGFNGSLIFTLNNGFVVEIPNEELANPLRGIDRNGARVLQPNITEVNIFSQAGRLNTAVLGKVFLSQVYLAVDYTMNQFQLAHMVPGSVPEDVALFSSSPNTCSSASPSPASPSTAGPSTASLTTASSTTANPTTTSSTTDSPSTEKSGLGTGGIAGIVVGCVAVLSFAGAFYCFCWLPRQSKGGETVNLPLSVMPEETEIHPSDKTTKDKVDIIGMPVRGSTPTSQGQ